MRRLLVLLLVVVPHVCFALFCAECGKKNPDDAKFCMSCGKRSSSRKPPPPVVANRSAFGRHRESLVLVISKTSRGSGFIAEMGGKKYILTNSHVIMGAEDLRFVLLSGAEVQVKSLELANDYDLARLEISNTDLPALLLNHGKINMHSPVRVLGNSQGSDAITELKGKVIAVGIDKIEIDAEFVSGNSGSPIIGQDGKVLAVATYATYTSGMSDWVVKGTRFAQARRFAIRVLPSYKWTSISRAELLRQDELLKSISGNVTDLYYTYILLLYSCNQPGFEKFAAPLFANRRVSPSTVLREVRQRFSWKEKEKDKCREALLAYVKSYNECIRLAHYLRMAGKKSTLSAQSNKLYKKKYKSTFNKTMVTSKLKREIQNRAKLLNALFEIHVAELGKAKWCGGGMGTKADSEKDFINKMRERFSDIEKTDRYVDCQVKSISYD